MKLQQLKYFQAACRYKSISKAAQALHISQPAISMAIRDLEEEFGVILLHHQRNAFILTQEGEHFLELAGGLIDHSDEITRIMNDLGSQRHLIRLGMPPMLGALLFPVIYADFLKRFPETELFSQEAGKTDLLEGLDNNRLDIAFIAHSPSEDLPFRYHSSHVCDLETVCCISEQNPLSESAVICPGMLKDTPIVMFTNTSYQSNQLDKLFGDAGIRPQIIHKSVQLSTIESLVASNVAVGFMFRELAENLPGIRCASIDPKLLSRISLVWNKDTYISGDVMKFVRYFKDFELNKL